MSHVAPRGEDYRDLEVRPGGSVVDREWPSKVGTGLLLGLPGAMTVYFAFNSGGMYEVTTAFGACVVLAVMAMGVAGARVPLAGLSRRGLVACGSLALFALWTLLSARWSHATGRALVSFDRVLLYLAVLTLFACIPRTLQRFRWMLRGLLAGSATVSLIGLISRLLPAVWPTGHGLAEERLSYPITYWNTFALLVAMACILAVHHTCDECEPRVVRVGAAALLPLLGATLLMTFSRGALAVTAIGVLAYIVIARPRGFLGGALATAPTTALAVSQSYAAELIQRGTPLTPAAVTQGRHLGFILVICALSAGLIRAVALLLDARVARMSIVRWGSRRVRLIGVVGVASVVIVAAATTHGPSLLTRQYEKFVNDTHQARSPTEGPRDRLLYVGNDGRLPLWTVALEVFQRNPLKGSGAGTFRLQWELDQQGPFDRVYAYSLYAEVLAELGLVGIVLLGVSLLTILIGIIALVRGRGKSAYAAALALGLAWVLHAGVDIDWQTPAVSVLIFGIGGFALAKSVPEDTQAARADPAYFYAPSSGLVGAKAMWLKPFLALACLAVAVFPARMALAQSRLWAGVDELDSGRCSQAQVSARGAIAALDTGPWSYEVLAMCAARKQELYSAVRWAASAVKSDPHNWETHYVSALVDGVAGRDPLKQAEQALRLDPLGRLPQSAIMALNGHSTRAWRSASLRLPFYFS
jgi:hypothetical protein